jgi:serine/threonine protein kinase
MADIMAAAEFMPPLDHYNDFTAPPCKHQQQHQTQTQTQRANGRRTVSYLEQDIQQVVAQSLFLQEAQPGDHITLFHKSEIVTGKLLGRGGFSDVYEVVGFELNEHISRRLTPQQRQLRDYYRYNVATGGGEAGGFAVKHLQKRLLSNQQEFQCAASDLVIEAAYLSVLDHENILKVRGLPFDGIEAFADGGHDGYFILLDRLKETLDDRIKKWKHQPGCNDVSLEEKGNYALQLACAIEYLHERRILFRDLKSANVGFTADGGIKILDFGLVRELPSSTWGHQHGDCCCDEVFRMSGVGTRRYMAVEIINTSLYNEKADVYSWSMLFWEMLALQKPFPTYSLEDHKFLVCEQGERPPLVAFWPQSIQNLLRHSWSDSIQDRLSMQEVHCLLKSILESLRMLDAPDSPVSVNDTSLMIVPRSRVNHVDGLLPRFPYIGCTGGSSSLLKDDQCSSIVYHHMQDISEASNACSLMNTSLLGMTTSLSSESSGREDLAQYHHISYK